jgi:hypothetical protein
MLSESWLNRAAATADLPRPEVWSGQFKDLPLDVKHEGYMVRDYHTEETLCKIKTKHYSFVKFWSRYKKAYDVEHVEEEYFEIVTIIRSLYTKNAWVALDPQSRRDFIERNL